MADINYSLQLQHKRSEAPL